jgi:hypothetical protein
MMRGPTVNSLQHDCIGHHLDELPLGKQLLGKQLGATLVHYVVRRCNQQLGSNQTVALGMPWSSGRAEYAYFLVVGRY